MPPADACLQRKPPHPWPDVPWFKQFFLFIALVTQLFYKRPILPIPAAGVGNAKSRSSSEEVSDGGSDAGGPEGGAAAFG